MTDQLSRTASPVSNDLGSDEVALLGMCDCLESIMRSQLLIDVVKMIAQGLRTDPKRLCNARSTASCRELPEDLELMGRERGNRRGTRNRVLQSRHLLGYVTHTAEYFLSLLLGTDVTRKMNKDCTARSPIQIGDKGNIQPYPFSGASRRIQIEIG
jgi:hypothetical protein